MRQFDVRPDCLLEVVGNGSFPVTPRSIYPVQQAVSRSRMRTSNSAAVTRWASSSSALARRSAWASRAASSCSSAGSELLS